MPVEEENTPAPNKCCSCEKTFDAEGVIIQGGDAYCEECHEEKFCRCGVCLSVIFRGASLNSPNDEPICESCYSDNVGTCSGCNEEHWHDNLSWDERREGDFCISCARTDPEITELASKTFKLNPSRRFVGFELEFVTENCVPQLSEWGEIKEDGSIKIEGDETAHEFASHAINGDRLIKSIALVAEKLSGATVNASCGFHVHLDMRDSTIDQRQNLMAYWQAFEPLFFAMVPESRRGRSWCKPCAGIGTCAWESDRYRALNIAAFEKYSSFECRLHQATLNFDKIAGWIHLLLAFFDGFENVPATPERIAEVAALNERERLILLFHQCAMPLSLCKWIVKRLRKHSCVPARLKRAA
jgi:hypothetical protein